jgi:hypothetical protein
MSETSIFVKISCPACDQHIEIPEELVGHGVVCPHCNRGFVVPKLPNPRRLQKIKRLTTLLIFGALLAVVFGEVVSWRLGLALLVILSCVYGLTYFVARLITRKSAVAWKIGLASVIGVLAFLVWIGVSEYKDSAAHLAWMESHPVGHSETLEHRTARFADEAKLELRNECAKTVGFRRIVESGIVSTNMVKNYGVSSVAELRAIRVNSFELGDDPNKWIGWANVEFINPLGGVQLTNLPLVFRVPLQDMDPDLWHVACGLDYRDLGNRDLAAWKEEAGSKPTYHSPHGDSIRASSTPTSGITPPNPGHSHLINALGRRTAGEVDSEKSPWIEKTHL